ncbi:hypothetical protein [Prevotella melaninogenica]|jgi:hypothetical protein|uniref:hypothetical protein n=1 Tax=Prevotella melaninogenica TaxID=28132 RepID=UPI001C5CFC9C|nr:hypothetical protein [Prevotella melaninogenica]MBW4730129.1 hypothetical protein [Prevotella melaninogenica]MBW4732081.1 hypothetical protein [Prevotella melaninogenica]MBW4750281.1 hypothetical protein [Prevotella melaninogenica]
MIDFSVLHNCLLQSCFFKQHNGKVTKYEQQKKANKLEQVTYEHAGEIIEIENHLLKKCKDSFNSNLLDCSYQCDCDGIFLLQVGDKDYIVYSEMKSKFDEKAIWQISSSVVRTKLLLSSIKDFGLENYQELGIIISYPIPVEIKIDDNDSFKINKREMISTYHKAIYRCKAELKKEKSTTVNGSDFSMSDAHIAEQYQPNDMIIKHVEVPEGDTSCSVNIDNLIASL